MAGPGDEIAAGAGGHGRLRASHADRERVIGTLKAALVQGMLTKDELDARVGQAFASRTYADLAAVTADLPAGLAADRLPRQPARARVRRPMSNAAKASICVVLAVAVPVILSIPTGGAALFVFALFYLMASLVAAAQRLASRHEQRSRRRQLPPRRAQVAPALESEQDSNPGDDLILCRARSSIRTPHRPEREGIRRTWRSGPVRRNQRLHASLQVSA